MNKKILDITQQYIHMIESNDISVTEIFIGYKVVTYARNNEIELTNEIFSKIVANIYANYLETDEYDLIDEIIYNYLNEKTE